MRADNKKYQRSESDTQRTIRRPYDSREIDRLPQPTKDDPPYRSWWIVDGLPSSEGADPQA